MKEPLHPRSDEEWGTSFLVFLIIITGAVVLTVFLYWVFSL